MYFLQRLFYITAFTKGCVFNIFNHKHLICELQKGVDYTHQMSHRFDYFSPEAEFYRGVNRDIHKGINYARFKTDKVLYLGWTPLKDPNILNTYKYPKTTLKDFDVNTPYLYLFLDIMSEDTLTLSHIIENPYIDCNVDLVFLRSHMEQYTFDNNIEVDTNPLKKQKSHWYNNLNLHGI
tara:strand:+ start:18099 stop:18635 length:537 start_codon:yes stop_codon:yes gene_type:complete